MISIILSIGAINALIPLIIILILIVAAAGLMRGYNIFALFGIGVLLGGAGKATLTGKNVARMTAGFRQGSITRNKATALEAAYIQKTATKGKTFAKYYKQEYSAARANGVSRVEAAKIASSNARIRMMHDNINKFQSGLNEGTKIYTKMNNKIVQVKVPLTELLNMLENLNASSALKNDTYAQNLYNSINSEINKLNSLAAQAKQIQQQLNRTSPAAAKANLDMMRKIQEDYRETAHNLIKDLHRYERRYSINRGTKENVPYYVSRFVNRIIPNKLSVPNPPSYLTNIDESKAHAYWSSFSQKLEKSFKEAFKS